MGIDFTVENLSKSQPNAAPFLPTSHHPHSYDFAIPIRGANSRTGTLACHWPATGSRCGRPPGKRLNPLAGGAAALLLNPKSLKPLPSLLFLAPAGPFVFWGIRENSEIRIEQRAGKMVLGILGALLGVLLRRGGTWSGSRRNLFGGPGAAAISCRASPGP